MRTKKAKGIETYQITGCHRWQVLFVKNFTSGLAKPYKVLSQLLAIPMYGPVAMRRGTAFNESLTAALPKRYFSPRRPRLSTGVKSSSVIARWIH